MEPSAHQVTAPRKTMHHYAYRRSRDQDAGTLARHPLVVVGAGPVGLTAALDFALRGIPVVLLDDADQIGEGSRAICWSKRTLEILDRLGVGEQLVAQGVTWKLGKVFQGEDLVHSFGSVARGRAQDARLHQLAAIRGREGAGRPRARGRNIDLRWKNKVVGIERHNDHVLVRIDTPEGPYKIAAEWLIAADGARRACAISSGLVFPA